MKYDYNIRYNFMDLGQFDMAISKWLKSIIKYNKLIE